MYGLLSMQIQEKRRFQENSEIDAFIFCTPMRCWKLVGHDLSGYLVYDVLAGEQMGKEKFFYSIDKEIKRAKQL